MRSLDDFPSRVLGDSRITWPRLSPCHVPPVRLLYVSLFSHVTLMLYAQTLYVMVTSLWRSSSRLPTSRWRRYDVLPVYPYACIFARRLSSPVLVTPSSLPGSSPFYHLPDWTLFLSLTFTAFAPVCTCISHTCIYTGLEMGRSPSSIYFATTLVLWPVRSHVLSLDRSVRWPRLFALRDLREFPSVYLLTGSEVQPTQCTSVRS